MTLIQSLILAVVQGITEFLPISSKGHLNLFSSFLGITPSLSFDIFLNTATLFSVIFFFRKQASFFFKNLRYIFIGTLPAVIAGFLFKSQISYLVTQVKFLPYLFLVTTVYLFITKFLKPKNNSLNYSRAVIIGIFQALALLPAISRSGSTIFAGLLVGLSSVNAFNFSFALFIPASIGALVLDLKDTGFGNFLSPYYLLSFLLTFIVGIIALSLLKKVLISNRLWYFAFYTTLLASILLIIL